VSEEEEGEGRKAGASVLVFFQGKGVSALFPGCPKIFSLKIVICKFSPLHAYS
jgi:hypothetical protein